MQSPLQILWDAGDLSSLTRDDIDAKEHVTSRGRVGEKRGSEDASTKEAKVIEGRSNSMRQQKDACELASVAAAAFLPANSSG